RRPRARRACTRPSRRARAPRATARTARGSTIYSWPRAPRHAWDATSRSARRWPRRARCIAPPPGIASNATSRTPRSTRSWRRAPVIALAVLLLAAADPKLLPGARGKICLDCHHELEAKLKEPFLHAPVKAQECTGCHSPHASEHGKLLDAVPDKLCASCHRQI